MIIPSFSAVYSSMVGAGSSSGSSETDSSSGSAMSLDDYFKTYYIDASGRSFLYISSTVNFWDAESACLTQNMKLACPQNPLQQAAIENVVKSTSWLGFVDYFVDGEFRCADGNARMGWSNWGRAQPDNSYNEETDADFTVIVYDKMSSNHLKWEDTGSYDYPDHVFGAVCQMECTVGTSQGCIPDRWVFKFLSFS